MVRRMELIPGLPPLTQYAAGAAPMFNCFQERLRVTLYILRMPKLNLNAKNTVKSPFAV